MRKKDNSFRPFASLPPFFGGKRNLILWIFFLLAEVIPRSEWSNSIFLDAFAGGCSVSLYAKALGFKAVHSNDWSDRTQIIFHALLTNQTQQLSKEDLLYLSQPLPEGIVSFIEENFVPHVLSTRHAQALDRVLYWADQYKNTVKRNLALLLMWHLIQTYVCMPTSINTSNRPYAETLDGLRDYQELNPKRFLDKSFPRLLKPRWNELKSLQKKVNAGVIGGSPVSCYQMDVCQFLRQAQGDIVYLDPPYPGTLSYESSLKTLDALLFGRPIESANNISSFSKDVNSLKPLFDSATHIPVWILSYGNNRIDLEGLVSFVQSCAPDRLVQGYQQPYRHLAHVSKAQDRKELLIIATTKETLNESC